VTGGTSDEAPLVARAVAGDREALGTLLDRHAAQARGMMGQILGPRADLDDLLGEARLRAVRGIEGFESRSAFATWYSQIAVHVALSEIRRRRRAEARPLPLPGSPGEDASRPAERRELRERLAAAVERLPPALRQVFDLVHREEIAPADVAERLAIPAATVRTRLFHARRRLREALDDLMSE